MDVLTAEQRHRNMSAIRSRNTKPEILVRHFLWGRGFRYRLNKAGLPGHPDIVLSKYRSCIFVNGCFWHGHKDCRYFRLPATNRDFWQKKIARNMERDAEELQQLAAMGWHCITIWECWLKKDRRESTLESLVLTLKRIYEEDHGTADLPEAGNSAGRTVSGQTAPS